MARKRKDNKSLSENSVRKTLPVGKTTYGTIHNDIHIKGMSYTEKDMCQSAQIIADVCFDASGKKEFDEFLLSLSDTGFKPMTDIAPAVKSWQVGEGFAEAYLIAHFRCSFPWSNNRDLKNPKSSLTGADMVGFHQGKFAFGEVKTSMEQEYPPQVTYKKPDGLNIQLKNLCQDHDLRWVLVQYLFHRVKSSTEYQCACSAYLKSNQDFYVFGVLVRSVEPKINDWNYLKKYLKVHEKNKVFLIALYLPSNDGIDKLHACVLSKRATP